MVSTRRNVPPACTDPSAPIEPESVASVTAAFRVPATSVPSVCTTVGALSVTVPPDTVAPSVSGPAACSVTAFGADTGPATVSAA